jgi:polyhydroxyalkanoate synthesis regulator phasin
MASEINSGGFLERRFRMIVSETPYRVKSRWLQACVLLCAVVVLPLGLAYGQDHKAVAKRLKAAVQAGELTGEEAKAMLNALRKTRDAKKEVAKSDADTQLKATWEMFQDLVQAGHLTKEQARTRMAAIKKTAARNVQGVKKVRARLKKAREELESLLEAGKISREEYVKKYKDALKKILEKREAEQEETRANESRDYLAKLKKKIDAEVRADKISEEAAKKMYEGAERAINEGKKMRAHLKKTREKLDVLLEAGEISREEYVKRCEDALKEAREKWEADQEETRANESREYLMNLRKKIDADVQAGKISEEVAKELYERAETAIEQNKKKAAKIKQDIEKAKARRATVKK